MLLNSGFEGVCTDIVAILPKIDHHGLLHKECLRVCLGSALQEWLEAAVARKGQSILLAVKGQGKHADFAGVGLSRQQTLNQSCLSLWGLSSCAKKA